MKYRIMSINILLAMCLSLLTAPASAAVSTWGADVVGGSLTATLDDEGTLTISGDGAMTNHQYVSLWAGENIRKVIISGAASIGQYAFAGCGKLETVIIGDSVTEIGNYAFDNCFNLSCAIIPSSVTTFETSSLGSLKYHPFNGCDNLTIYGTSGSTAQTFASTYSIPSAFLFSVSALPLFCLYLLSPLIAFRKGMPMPPLLRAWLL